jgi:hypothetical protein
VRGSIPDEVIGVFSTDLIIPAPIYVGVFHYGLQAERLEFDFRLGNIFLFLRASRPALGPTQSRIQWVQASFLAVLKRPVYEADAYI